MCNSPEISNFQFTDGLLVCLENFKETITFNVNNMFTKFHIQGAQKKLYTCTFDQYNLGATVNVTVSVS